MRTGVDSSVVQRKFCKRETEKYGGRLPGM